MPVDHNPEVFFFSTASFLCKRFFLSIVLDLVLTCVPADDIFITIEEECLKGAIEFNAIESTSSIPENFFLDFVGFDVYCNTSEGGQLEVRLIGLLF